MTAPGFIPLPNAGGTPREVAEAVNGILAGKLNAVAAVTLVAGGTTTTLTDSRIGPSSFIGLFPNTANAAGALATTYIQTADKTKGSAVITHANTATVDRTFAVLVIG